MGLRWPGVQSVLIVALLLVLAGLASACGQSTPASSTSPSPLVASASPQPLAGFDLWVAGTSIFSSRDGGATWRAMRTPHDLFWGVAAGDARHVWVAGSSGEILATRDGGTSWSLQQPPSERQLGPIACSDARHVAAAGIAPGGVFVLVTSDGGRHWHSSPLMKTSHDLEGIASPDAQHIWAVGSPGLPSEAPGGIIASRDGGATWTVQQSDRDVSYRGVAFSDARSGWAVGYGDAKGSGSVIAHTTDGGATWTQLRLSGVDGLLSVTCSDAQHAWAVGDAFDGSSAAIASTQDGGKTWSVRPVKLAGAAPQHLSLMAVTCSDASHIWVAGTTQHAGIVLASSDSGTTWTVQSRRPDMAILRAVTWASGQ